MAERVVPVMDGVEWEPNVPAAVLLQDDRGRACLALNAHFNDDDQRSVVLVWHGCLDVMMGGQNDEGIHLHRLFGAGLVDVLWIGEVHDSSWLAAVGPTTRRPVPRHFIVLTKEVTIEVLADSVEVRRFAGPTLTAANTAFTAST